MHERRKILAISISVTILLVFSFGLTNVSGESISSWTSTTRMPDSLWQFSCASYSGYVYCVAGADPSGYTDTIYYAPLLSTGVGTWSMTTNNYTMTTGQESCVTSGSYIYCVGGINPSTNSPINDVYYAQLSSTGGIGSWTATTSYPTGIKFESCVAAGVYIYCVGGTTSSTTESTVVYSALLSATGVGSWTLSTNSYPIGIEQESCFTDGQYIYCVGGETTGFTPTDSVYVASISGGDVGPWSLSTNSYPESGGIADESCVLLNGYVYCVGGDYEYGLDNAVNYATASGGSIGAWTSTTAYPRNVQQTVCVTNSGTIYCMDGETIAGELVDNVYYTAPAFSTTTSTTSTTTSSTSTSSSSTSTTMTTSSPTGVPEFPDYGVGLLVLAVSSFSLIIFLQKRGAGFRRQAAH